MNPLSGLGDGGTKASYNIYTQAHILYVPYKSTPNRVSWHPTHTSLTGKPLFRTRTSTYPPRTLTISDSSA